MKTASIHEIKQELQQLAPRQLAELCLKLARFKKENKELLTYILFERDEQEYLRSVKALMDGDFSELPFSNFYLTKKSVRKILKYTTKYVRMSSSRQIEIELLIYFCFSLRQKIPIEKSTSMKNLYFQQVKKIKAAILTLHEDLQRDYTKQLEEILNTGFC